MPDLRCPKDHHAVPWNPCQVFGGCPAAPPWDPHRCRSGRHCRAYDTLGRHPAEATPRDPLCATCLASAERDVRLLVFDWLDLEQLQLPVLSQALDTQRGGRAGPPMPMAGAPDALQAEIHYVLTLWERELRLRQRMARKVTMVVGAWHTTVTNRPPPPRVRPGVQVQRAVGIVAPRLDVLARIGPTTVFPAGRDDDPQDVTGWEAVHQLVGLRSRARAMLGRTHRTFWVPGDCSDCGARDLPDAEGPLYRAEPRDERDEPPIWCDRCGGFRTWDDYQRYLTLLVWPARHMEAAA